MTRQPLQASSTPPVPRLLSGGNPQIPKGDGDVPVRAYLDAVPGWKRGVCERIDTLVAAAVPGVQKAVRWNTPFYGLDGRGWFLAYHCLTKHVKLTFFRGTSLDPPPPVASKQPDVRSLHLPEDERIDEAQLTAWIRQAAALPGETLF